MVRSPENTSKRDPLLHLALAMGGGASGFIEDMEATGQGELVRSEVLPTEGLHKEDMLKLINGNGGTIGERVPDDSMFTQVTLPPGWSKRPTDHSMWSELVDANGNVRAMMFYKAAFYDRSANISPCCRFSIDSYCADFDKGEIQACVKDAKGEVKFATEMVVIPKDDRSRWAVKDAHALQVKEFLDANYPDWESPLAHW